MKKENPNTIDTNFAGKNIQIEGMGAKGEPKVRKVEENKQWTRMHNNSKNNQFLEDGSSVNASRLAWSHVEDKSHDLFVSCYLRVDCIQYHDCFSLKEIGSDSKRTKRRRSPCHRKRKKERKKSNFSKWNELSAPGFRYLKSKFSALHT